MSKKKKMQFGGYLIVQLENQLTIESAFSELLDNAIDYGATKISIDYTKHSMTICDNGEGCDDPNLIATPSLSASRHKQSAIGSRAAGGKQAMAFFGRVWDIHTVVRGRNRYHHYKVSWDENGPAPDQYSGRGQPSHDAPAEIRHGGTKIIVTQRQDGFPVVRMESICRQLEIRYRPCLSSGQLSIAVFNPETQSGRQLKNAAFDHSLFVGPIIEAESATGPRPFMIRYGALKEHHPVLSGCHIIFGPRVIKTMLSIGRLSLPAGCYVDVILSDNWKKALSTNKTRIGRYSDELFAELERMLATWIEAQKKQAQTYKLQLLAGQLSHNLSERLSYLSNRSDVGTHQPLKKLDKIKTESNEHEQIEVQPRQIKPHRPRDKRAEKGGKFSGWQETSRRNCTELKVEFDEKLNRLLFSARYIEKESHVEVRLNVGPHQRLIAAYSEQGKANEELFSVAAMAFSLYVARNRSSFLSLFEGMRARGYEIYETDEETAVSSMVANCLIDSWYETRFKSETVRHVA